MSIKPHQQGLTLIELIVFIVIVSVGVVGLVSVFAPLVQSSAAPMRQKQLAAIAESVLSEVLHQPFTWCDPDDPAASTAVDATTCANPQDKDGAALTSPTPGTEVRGGAGIGNGFDNVADYGGFNVAAITDPTGNNTMAGYAVRVDVARAGLALGAGADDAALAITVTVTRDGESLALTGYRFRYAPRI